MKVTELTKEIGEKLPIHGEISFIAKGFAKDMATKLFLRTMSATARIKAADKEKLAKALKAGGVVLVGFLIASKLFGIQVILAVMGGTILLDDLLKKVEDETERAKIEAAFTALKSQEPAEPAE